MHDTTWIWNENVRSIPSACMLVEFRRPCVFLHDSRLGFVSPAIFKPGISEFSSRLGFVSPTIARFIKVVPPRTLLGCKRPIPVCPQCLTTGWWGRRGSQVGFVIETFCLNCGLLQIPPALTLQKNCSIQFKGYSGVSWNAMGQF